MSQRENSFVCLYLAVTRRTRSLKDLMLGFCKKARVLPRAWHRSKVTAAAFVLDAHEPVMKTCPHPFCPWSGACSLARSGEGGSLSGVVKDWTSVDVYSWFPVSRRDRAAGGRRQVTPS